MIEKYTDILKKVHQLAVIRHKQEIKNSREDNPNDSVIDLADIRERRDESELLQFLLDQDMETIKIIQTVMYIGRDYIQETEEENIKRMEWNYEYPESPREAPDLQSPDPEKLLNDWLSDFRGQDKYIEANQVYEKLPLDEYLERAFIILGI